MLNDATTPLPAASRPDAGLTQFDLVDRIARIEDTAAYTREERAQLIAPLLVMLREIRERSDRRGREQRELARAILRRAV